MLVLPLAFSACEGFDSCCLFITFADCFFRTGSVFLTLLARACTDYWNAFTVRVLHTSMSYFPRYGRLNFICVIHFFLIWSIFSYQFLRVWAQRIATVFHKIRMSCEYYTFLCVILRDMAGSISLFEDISCWFGAVLITNVSGFL